MMKSSKCLDFNYFEFLLSDTLFKIKHLIWSLLRKQITDFAKAVNGWSPSQTSKIEPSAEIINGLNPCQTSMTEHFRNTVNEWNPCRTSRMKLFAKVVNGWSLCQISQLELFGKIFNQSNPCQGSKMELLQKQLSDEVCIKHLSWMEPFVKIVTQTSKIELFAKICKILVKHLTWRFLRKYLTDGI